MAHVAKYTASASGHLTAHYERRQVPVVQESGETTMEYIRFGNQDIDLTRTHLNYNLAPNHEGGQLAFLEKRLSEVRTLKRADVNVMFCWVTTLPKYESMNKTIHVSANEDVVSRLFFERTYRFLAERYGEQNIVSSYVHRDENRDHMHTGIIPVVEDKKHGGEKLSAKEVVTRADLRSFHEDLERYLDSFGDWHFEVQNDATRDGNKSIAELKRGTAVEELARVQADAERQKQEIRRDLERAEAAAAARRKELQKGIEALEEKRDGIYTSLEARALEGKKTVTGALKGVTYEEYLTLKRTAERVDMVTAERDAALDARDEAITERDRAKSQIFADANRQLQAAKEKLQKEYAGKDFELTQLRRENQILSGKVNRLEQAVEYLKAVVREKLPEFFKSVERQVNRLLGRDSERER